jgi:glycosyltransferase involved in cell wall biosynthesis
MHDAYHAVVSNLLKKIYNVPLVVTLHSMNTASNSLIDNFRRFSLYNASMSIFVSDSLKQKAIERYNIHDTDHFKVVYNGVEINEETNTQNKNDKNIKGSNRIVFCGRLAPVKGVDILLKAFHILYEKVEDAELVIIGDGISKDELKLMCIEQNISDRVHFVGNVDNAEVRNYFRNSDIVAVPSREEPFGLVAIEAMSEKACVVCSNVGGLKEIVKSGYNGMLFENENYIQLAGMLLELMSNKELRFKLAENGFKEANNYSWHKASEKIYSYYNELLEN